MRWEGLLLNPAGSVIGRCLMVNVSATGAKLIMPDPSEVPDSFVLVLSKKGEVRRQCEVTWRSQKSIGVRFIAIPAVEVDETSYIEDALARISAKA
jgi:hypothetical protein